MNYLLKHIVLLKSYLYLGYRRTIEYKFLVITNFVSYLVTALIWIFFWDLIFSKVQSIGQWNLPMLMMMVGFVLLSDALWQFGFYTLNVSKDIVEARLDKYLTRPINPLYAIIMDYTEIMTVFPIILSLSIIIYTLINYFSFNLIKLLLSLTIVLIGVSIIQIIFCIIGTLAFWFGRTRELVSIYRNFRVANQFPLDILSPLWRGFFTFVLPALFFGTYPVLMMLEWDFTKSIKVIALGIIILIFWCLILWLLWKRGMKNYESMGG